jgi:hypothetical protein
MWRGVQIFFVIGWFLMNFTNTWESCALIACPHLLVWATKERLLPIGANFNYDLISDNHMM